MIYLACISLVYVLWELLSECTEYLEPSCFCFSPVGPLTKSEAVKARAERELSPAKSLH